jgi:hypothetical protein
LKEIVIVTSTRSKLVGLTRYVMGDGMKGEVDLLTFWPERGSHIGFYATFLRPHRVRRPYWGIVEYVNSRFQNIESEFPVLFGHMDMIFELAIFL